MYVCRVVRFHWCTFAGFLRFWNILIFQGGYGGRDWILTHDTIHCRYSRLWIDMTSRHHVLCGKLYLDTSCGCQPSSERVGNVMVLHGHVLGIPTWWVIVTISWPSANSPVTWTSCSTFARTVRSTCCVSLRRGMTLFALGSIDYELPIFKSSTVHCVVATWMLICWRIEAAWLALLRQALTCRLSTRFSTTQRRSSTSAFGSQLLSLLRYCIRLPSMIVGRTNDVIRGIAVCAESCSDFSVSCLRRPRLQCSSWPGRRSEHRPVYWVTHLLWVFCSSDYSHSQRWW